MSIDFNNTKVAFHLKSDSDLERAYFLFKMISIEPLVRIGTAATKFALKVNLPVEGLIRSTVFDHFCGGVSQFDCISKINQMYSSHVFSVLDYSVEGKKDNTQFDLAVQKTIELISFSKDNEAMPIAVFKPSGFGRFEIYNKISDNKELTSSETEEWLRIKERFNLVCAFGKSNNIKILIDAEESWIQEAVDDLILEMMQLYNKESVVVYNTLQTYRWDRLNYLKQIHLKSKKLNFKLGIKIVRGAYMEKERLRAYELGYKSPICETKELTDALFNNTLKYVLENLNQIQPFIGTHNEQSTALAVNLMDVYNIPKNDTRVWFGQLYGMSDHISYNLATNGYNVAKYVPFGPVKDVMPYLIRRAEENTSVAGQTSRELNLISIERKRRKI
ncbi:MAG: proline dehydrogenase [Formosa sp.]|jgi:proline dehydrogenase|nr:proline dehydrogenase [Formosa sp.]MDC3350867.1 proline dehydrogenase family protein [Flavobacteriaceae bacterium]|tara:strand:- start:19541 stop:20707 length:1167 start_codon:yes stop_codon:yes gene_type:complete